MGGSQDGQAPPKCFIITTNLGNMSSNLAKRQINILAMQTLRRMTISYRLARRCCVVNSSFRRNIAFSHGSTIVPDDKYTSHTSTEGKKSSQANPDKEERDNNKSECHAARECVK